jgi:hypothetical protein
MASTNQALHGLLVIRDQRLERIKAILATSSSIRYLNIINSIRTSIELYKYC